MMRLRVTRAVLSVMLLSVLLLGGSCGPKPRLGYTLTNMAQGNGTVTPPAGSHYDPGAVVELTATPAPGAVFVSWQGTDGARVSENKILMDADRSITAMFEQLACPLNVISRGRGSVRQELVSPKSASYTSGSVAKLTALPAAGWAFDRWEGGLTGRGNPGSVLVDKAMAVTCVFVSAGRIAFNSTRDGNCEIYAMNADGTGQTRLTNNGYRDSGPCWSPDGTRIAFTSARDGGYEVYAIDSDGTGLAQLTDNVWGALPSWSPDGSQIAFSSGGSIYVMGADGSGQTRLTNASGGFFPRWSPDGKKLAFVSSRDGNQEVYVMNADGTGQVRLTTDSALDADPCWSRDGGKIAFVSYRDGNGEVYAMGADGTGQTRLTSSGARDNNPCWSPSGDKIAFVSDRDGNGEVYVMNADGSDQANLTMSPGDDNSPDWSLF